jgi:hypothetical protein
VKNRIIWIISPEAWGEHLLSKHHYAITLARRGNEVVFIEPDQGIQKVREVPGVADLVLLDWRPVKGLRRFPKPVARYIQRREFLAIGRKTQTRPDVIWSFDNSRFFDLDANPFGAKTIHHVVDLNQNFEFERAARSAHLCLATTRYITAKLEASNANSHLIGHGCDPVNCAEWKPQNLLKKQVVYTGNLLIPLLDHNLLRTAIETHANVDFHFVGAYTTSNVSQQPSAKALNFIQYLQGRSNVRLHGALRGAAYHKALALADLFIIAYQQSAHEQIANPHKVPELLSTGRAIVSVVLDFYRDLDLVYMAHDSETWQSLLTASLNDLEHVNNPDLQAKRRTWAFQHSYDQQINLITEWLQ